MTEQLNLSEQLSARFGDQLQSVEVSADESPTVTVLVSDLLDVCQALKQEQPFCFDTLIDVCGVDYLDYGVSEWRTTETTTSGFSRGQSKEGERVVAWDHPRFAVVYHFLSVKKNQRLRLRVFMADEKALRVPSVNDIWPAANWFEREAFDLFGFEFEGHPDLRRILTDYGFKGHPFRKDFPLIGEVELRYDAASGRCIYEPVTIQPRVNVPKVIRQDNRYVATPTEEKTDG